MSNLTEDEITAGISRAAIAKIRSNGNGKANLDLGDHLRARQESGILEPARLYVVDTVERAFDLVNLDGWRFRIRDLRRSANKIESIELAMDRPELERLAQIITKMLSESRDPKTLRGKSDR